MMEAHKSEPSICFNLDCMEGMKAFPDKLFDLAVVDPPYFSGPEHRGYYGSRVSKTGVHRDYPITPKWDVPGKDYPAAILLLQKRWEDANGNVYAKRIGTMVTYYYHSTDWKNNATYEIMYGDITNRPEYKSHMMRLQATESYTVNSKGESVPIHEVAWGDENDVPTHMCLQFTSSHGGAYIGSPGNTLWIDNVKLVY